MNENRGYVQSEYTEGSICYRIELACKNSLCDIDVFYSY